MFILQAFSLFTGIAWSFPAEQKLLTAPLLQKPVTLQKVEDKPALRKLQGRFLHITGTNVNLIVGPLTPYPDIHPDVFYEAHSSTDFACHSGKGTAGIFGAEISDCDTPISLVNATFQWIKDNLKDEIDFVIWTGDSARHDNDEYIPRTETQVVQSNRMIVEKFVEVFGKDDNIEDPDPTNDFVVPIVPTFGNNDILPHNIFPPGPNKWTRDYAEIWQRFIPEAQRHSFARGGWFFTEVIPNKLAVFSLNTMYFFDSNSAVDGCDMKSEPGYEHMEWLRVQLQFLRERGMKAIMIGHVPPARTVKKRSWDESCWQKYSFWMRQYRDVVVAGMFGHMNLDHFIIQDASELKYNSRRGLKELGVVEGNATEPMFSIESKAGYLTDLREGWTGLPTPPSGMSYSELARGWEAAVMKRKKHKNPNQEKRKKFLKDIGGKWAERFSLSLVSPSVIPNFYPTLRIVEYNITGLENEHPAVGMSRPAEMDIDTDLTTNQEPARWSADSTDDEKSLNHNLRKQTRKKHRNKHVKSPFKMPKPPSSTAPPGPAYSPQAFTFTSYTQYFANLTFINNDYENSGLTLEEYIGATVSKKGQKGSPVRHAKRFAYQVEYDTRTDKRYNMSDMTVSSYMDLAQKVAKDKHHKKKHVLDVLPDGSVVEIGGLKVKAEGLGDREADHQQSEKGKGRGTDKHKKKKKHRRKRKGKKEKNATWHTFVQRAFVMTKTDKDIEDF